MSPQLASFFSDTPSSNISQIISEESLYTGESSALSGVQALNFLRETAPFSQLPESELRELALSCRLSSVNAGQYITLEGEKDQTGFIVVAGRLAMMKTSVSGKELVVELLPAGDLFGLLIALQTLPSQLSARAQVQSTVLWFSVANFKAMLRAHPELYQQIIELLLECLHSSFKMSLGLAHARVEVRIATILSTLAIKFARRAPALQDYTIDITRLQLAELTGTTSETAIRVTRAMQRQGIIDISHPGVVRVTNLKALHELAEI